MVIFIAVMITDVILLDTFNTYGLPTSTTVSIVFELLGAAVAISLIKVMNSSGNLAEMGQYINSGKALAIISAILVSVVVALTTGTIVQWFSRLIFSFNYNKTLKYFGALWGGLVVTAIIYFILMKGAKGTSFMSGDINTYIKENTSTILLLCFSGLTILFQLLIVLFRINILRIIVLFGTFSLAMAFAGNDLVNFIGVPLAGYESYNLLIADPLANPATYTMGRLLEPIQTPTPFLVAAGIIMVLTLFFSKKSRTVTKTELDLARQDSGMERFNSSYFARTLVRNAIKGGRIFNFILPGSAIRFMDKRFDNSTFYKKAQKEKDPPSFDLIRASVNMFVASILIASATSLKLPLSTTYVTFMVAMGTSFADRAWGRESAVYRISGVITVIGGWFFTAFIAFTGAFLIAIFIHWGGMFAMFASLGFALFMVIKTHFIHKKKEEETKNRESLINVAQLDNNTVYSQCTKSIHKVLTEVSELYAKANKQLMKENRKSLRDTCQKIDDLNSHTKELKYNVYGTIKKLEEDSIESGHFYVQTLDYLREITHCLTYISHPIYEHLDNNHPPLIEEQSEDLLKITNKVSDFFNNLTMTLETSEWNRIQEIIIDQQLLIEKIEKMKKRQLKLIKQESIGTKNSLMVLNLLSETKNLLLYSLNLLKAQRDFSNSIL
jgi:phosphate/sulfate permease